MTSDKYALYLTDSFGEPDHWLKSDEKELGKEKKFSPNQKLILKPKELLAPSEIFKLQIFLTTTGSPDDFLFLQDIVVSRDLNLNEFKAQLCELPTIQRKDLTYAHLRVRIMQGGGTWGAVLRPADTT
jgi:hypothetical protein